MGTSLRAKRLSRALKVNGLTTLLYASSRACTRGLLLLVVTLFVSTLVNSQTPDQPDEIAAETLTRLQRELTGSVEGRRSALFEIRNLRSPIASEIAVAALSDSDELVRATAASSVVFLPPSRAVQVLVPLLSDKAEFVRKEAAYALGKVGDPSATGPLVRSMQTDKAFEVKTAAAVALGKAGDTSAVESLVRVLRSKVREDDEFLRRSAARSIGQIVQRQIEGEAQKVTPQNFLPDKFKDLGPRDVPPPAGFASALEVLTKVLQNGSESDDTRREAAFAIGGIGDQRSIPVLRAYTSSTDTYLAEIAHEAILTIERRNNIAVSGNK